MARPRPKAEGQVRRKREKIVKWWHRWRAAVWGNRYFYAVGSLETCDPNSLRYDELMAERATSMGAIQYHQSKLGKFTTFDLQEK